MNIHHVKKLAFRMAALAAVSPLVFSPSALSATPEPVDVTVTFVEVIAITEVNALDFGLLDALMAGSAEVSIDTGDTVTDLGASVVGGAQEAAEVTIMATQGVAVTLCISA
jgi:hypothetical protein